MATDFLGLQPSLNAGVYQSVSLAATTAAWQKLKASAEYQNFQDTLALIATNCPSSAGSRVLKVAQTLQAALAELDKAVTAASASAASSKEVAVPLAAGSTNQITIKIQELYSGQQTSAKFPSPACTISTPFLTLSAGVLVSSIPGETTFRSILPAWLRALLKAFSLFKTREICSPPAYCF